LIWCQVSILSDLQLRSVLGEIIGYAVAIAKDGWHYRHLVVLKNGRPYVERRRCVGLRMRADTRVVSST